MLGPSLSYGFVPQPCNKCFSFSECPLFSFLLLIAFCIAPKLIITITSSYIIVSCSFFSVSIDISSQFSSFPSLAYSYFFSKFECPQSKPAKLLSFLQFVFLSLSSHDTCLSVQLLLLISDRLHHRLHRPLKKQQKEELLLLSVCCRTLLLPSFPFFSMPSSFVAANVCVLAALARGLCRFAASKLSSSSSSSPHLLSFTLAALYDCHSFRLHCSVLCLVVSEDHQCQVVVVVIVRWSQFY